MADVTLLRGAVLGQGYRLGAALGDGGNAVYEATHERVQGRFVIRLFRDEALARADAAGRIHRSVRLASLLRDHRTVQLLDFSISGETPAFVVMEKLAGPSLAAVMAEQGMLPLGRVVEIVEALAGALDSAHRLGLVHGNLRPSLVFPSERAGEPAARLAGLGWARELRAAAKHPAPSGYLAPEQGFGKVLNIDARVDQFALAALAYELIAGCQPFSEESADLADRKGGVRRAPPAVAELVPGVPAAIDEVLRRALAAMPRDRFPSVLELASRLRAAAGGVAGAGAAAAPRALIATPISSPTTTALAASAPASSPFGAAASIEITSDATEELDIDEATLDDAVTTEKGAMKAVKDAAKAAKTGRPGAAPAPAPIGASPGARAAAPASPDRGRPAPKTVFADDILDAELDDGDDDEETVIRAPLPGTVSAAARASAPAAVERGIPAPAVAKGPASGGHATKGNGTATGHAKAAAPVEERTQISRSPFVEEDREETVDSLLEDAPSGRRSRSGRSGGASGAWSTRTTGSVVLTPPPSASGQIALPPARRGGRAIWLYVIIALAALGIAALAVVMRARRPPPGTIVVPATTATTPAPATAPSLAAASAPSATPPAGETPPAATAPAPGTPAPAAPATAPPAAAATAPAPSPAATPPAPGTPPAATAPAPGAPAAPTGATAAPPAAQAPPAPAAPTAGTTVRIEPIPPPPPPPPAAPAAKPAAPVGRGHSAVKPRPGRPVAGGRPAPSAAPAAGPAAAAPSGASPTGSGDCVIQIGSKPWAQIWIDGKNTGAHTPVSNYKVPCGTHKLQLKRPDRDIEQMEVIRAEKGQPFRRNYELE